MQPNPQYRIGLAEVRDLAERAPWMLLVSHPASGPVASPSPVLVDDASTADELVLVTHLGRADARGHGLLTGSAHEMLVVVQGEHGYISPSWYVGEDIAPVPTRAVPTWNFEMATLTCDVEVLSPADNLRVLQQFVAHFEGRYAPGSGIRLDVDDDANQGMAMGTVGLRLRVRSFDAKAKLSQNKSDATRASVIAHLDASHPRLAERMRASG